MKQCKNSAQQNGNSKCENGAISSVEAQLHQETEERLFGDKVSYEAMQEMKESMKELKNSMKLLQGDQAMTKQRLSIIEQGNYLTRIRKSFCDYLQIPKSDFSDEDIFNKGFFDTKKNEKKGTHPKWLAWDLADFVRDKLEEKQTCSQYGNN